MMDYADLLWRVCNDVIDQSRGCTDDYLPWSDETFVPVTIATQSVSASQLYDVFKDTEHGA
jgi:hypothetical protein